MMRRSSHAVLDAASRLNKAAGIYSSLVANGLSKSSAVLDVGTGSGHIASAIGSRLDNATSMVSVDVEDLRISRDNYEWRLVSGPELPLPSQSFDFAISNHVIEHLGSARDQVTHLKEIYRVLRPGGVLYLSVPNRWFFFERHFNLPFLSWLPYSAASSLVRLTGRGTHYDCTPLSRGRLESAVREAGFRFKSEVPKVVSSRFNIQYSERVPRWFALTLWVLSWVLLPTFVILATRPEQATKDETGD